MTRRIAINDANILIDLVKTGLLEASLQLPIVYYTTNIIFEELYETQKEHFRTAIENGNYLIIDISLEEMGEIYHLVPLDPNLSEQDWSAYYFAEKWSCMLLTGDNRLRTRASSSGIEVHGILWILDELVRNQKVTERMACELLEQLMKINRRLPLKECRERLTHWKPK